MKEEINRKVSRILSHDSNVSEKLSQSTMTHVEHSRLILEVLEEDIPSLFESIEQLEKALEEFANINNWNPHDYGSYVPEWTHISKPWEIARQALRKEK